LDDKQMAFIDGAAAHLCVALFPKINRGEKQTESPAVKLTEL